MKCFAETVTILPKAPSGKVYQCRTCNYRHARALIVDPEVSWWTDARDEYCHATAGMFLRRLDGKFLFFDRTKHPNGLTVPAGHLGHETALEAAVRETLEETGVRLGKVNPVGTLDIQGDECRRGADMHTWHVFAADLPRGSRIRIDESEGRDPVWLSLAEATQQPLTYAVRRVIQRFGLMLA